MTPVFHGHFAKATGDFNLTRRLLALSVMQEGWPCHLSVVEHTCFDDVSSRHVSNHSYSSYSSYTLAPRRSFLSLDLHVVEQLHLHNAVAHARIARKRGGINYRGVCWSKEVLFEVRKISDDFSAFSFSLKMYL